MAPQPAPAALGSETDARAFIADLAAHRFSAALGRCTGTMRAAFPVWKLAGEWAEGERAFGPFQAVDEARVSTEGSHRVVVLSAHFARRGEGLRVVFEADGRVAGFSFVRLEWEPPAYAAPARFTEREVSVGNAPSLPGTLTLPTGPGPFPAVVLVHDSGVSDADETISRTQKVFKDLAWGLASRGVAVLRYVKRGLHAPAGMVTIKEEVLDGAAAAVALLRNAPEIDSKRVVVVGHGQGAELAPRIASESPGVAAVVMMAPPSRPLQDEVLDQITYRVNLQRSPQGDKEDDGNVLLSIDIEAGLEAFRRSGLEQARAFKAALDDPALKPDADIVVYGPCPVYSPTYCSMKGAYFLSMRGYDPVKSAAALSIPILILHGDRDYEVPAVDLERFKSGLGGKSNVVIKEYGADNHEFVAGSGMSRPEEDDRAAHVDPQVIEDIATFVTKVR
jgi:dienelactone hydrolase